MDMSVMHGEETKKESKRDEEKKEQKEWEKNNINPKRKEKGRACQLKSS
jgi:hypothetical protein